MTNKIIELRDIYGNPLLPYAYSAVKDGDNNDIATTYATVTQLNTKQSTITGAASSVTSQDLSPNKALISNTSGKIAISTVTSTELSYLSGATENIPTAVNTIKSWLLPNSGSPGDTLIINDDKTGLVPGGSLYHPSLFSYQPADHLLNDIQWLRADTFSWQSGDVYKTAYNHLKDEFDAYWADKDPEVVSNWFHETIGSYTIWYTLAADGHKIVLPDHETTAKNIYDESGIAWYYILDKTNKRFKLPRRKDHGTIIERWSDSNNWYRVYADGWCEQGGYVRNGGNTTGVVYTINLLKPYKDVYYFINMWGGVGDSGWQYAGGVGYGTAGSGYNTRPNYNTTSSFTYFNSTGVNGTPIFWEAKGYVSNVIDYNENKYLYFYVGAFTQSAIQETAGITVEVLNNKLDVDLKNSSYPQFDCVISWQAPTAANNYTWYRLYKSGWVEQGGYGQAGATYTGAVISLLISMMDANYSVTLAVNNGENYNNSTSVRYTNRTINSFNAIGTYNGGFGQYQFTWEVKGMSAR